MLFAEINNILKLFRMKAYTGHLKFGIEKGVVVSITQNSRLEKSDNDNCNFERQLMELCQIPNFYGSIEFDLIMGETQRLNHCVSYNGQNLRDLITRTKESLEIAEM